MTGHEIAVGAAMLYFLGFGAVFMFRPTTASQLGLTWLGSAGKTEVRCYYGGVSWALAGFLGYLLSEDLATEALTGVIFLATAVFVTRVIGATVDGGWAETYNRQAIPIEGLFVLALFAFRLLA